MKNQSEFSWAKLPGLKNRYFNNALLEKILFQFLSDKVEVKVIGSSEENRPIYRVAIGRGKKNILAWSQMHGNETTNTRAILDLYNLLIHYNEYLLDSDEKQSFNNFLEEYTLYTIPILNPDGAEVYTRVNANKIDLNRDAEKRTQLESQILYSQVKELNPVLCLNLHDQRTLFGLDNKQPATISFLAPSANYERSITPARRSAMAAIERANYTLQQHISNQVGRFDDSFNINCSGDFFTNKEYPTILIEAGHYYNDYDRELIRNMLLLSYLAIFNILKIPEAVYLNRYNTIPENRKNYTDLILRDVKVENTGELMDIALYFREVFVNGRVMWTPEFLEVVTERESRNAHYIAERQLHEAKIDVNNILIWKDQFLTILNIYDKMLLKSIEIQFKLK